MSFRDRLGRSKHCNCRQNQPRGRRWLEMAARACPGAAAGSKWPLELAPEPQNARKVLLKPGPEPQNAREVLLEPAPEPQNARKVPLEPAPEPQTARNGPSSLPRVRTLVDTAQARPPIHTCSERPAQHWTSPGTIPHYATPYILSCAHCQHNVRPRLC